MSVTLQTVRAHGRDQLSVAFSTMSRDQAQAEAVVTFSDATTYNYPLEIAELATKTGSQWCHLFAKWPTLEVSCLMVVRRPQLQRTDFSWKKRK